MLIFPGYTLSHPWYTHNRPIHRWLLILPQCIFTDPQVDSTHGSSSPLPKPAGPDTTRERAVLTHVWQIPSPAVSEGLTETTLLDLTLFRMSCLHLHFQITNAEDVRVHRNSVCDF